ncbi:MAG: spore coat protein U domain-containing protein [Deltaproteobacteria bacterium]|nr:spore coat protein U domain-containing protein [Deltaproteobacteria bacterium]MBI2364849.1 spore coat protein U domain-containing protein [Deltaproteobacteria bacterium]
MTATILTLDNDRGFQGARQGLSKQKLDLGLLGEGNNGEAAPRSTPELRHVLVVMDIATPRVNGFDATLRIKTYRRKTKVIINLVSTALLLLHYSLADAGSASANLGVSAKVVRGCRVSTRPRDFSDTNSLGTNETREPRVIADLEINCGKGTGEANVTNVGANTPGSTVIRALSNGQLSYEIYKEAGLAAEGMGSVLGNLGLFPTAGWQVISNHGQKPVGENVPIGIDNHTLMLIVNF